MKKASPLVLLISLGALAGLTSDYRANSQSTTSPQGSTNMTSRALYEMIAHWTDRNRGLVYIATIYNSKINKDIALDKATLNSFGEVFVLYMENNRDKWDKPVEELVIEALKIAPTLIEEQKAFWANAYKAAEAYFSRPTPDNAEKFILALPDKRLPRLDFDGMNRLGEYVFDFIGRGRKNFGVLDKKVEEGDQDAVDICYRLRNISDGETSEILLYVMGTLVIKHPRLFLQNVIAHEPRSYDDLSHMLMMVAEWGEIPEAGNDAKKYEEIYNARIALRIRTLESVDDPDLKEIRDRCLAILKGTKPGHNLATTRA